MDVYTTYFNEKKLIIKSRLKLKDYTFLLVDVCSSIVKISTNRASYFNHFSADVIEVIQKYICTYCVFEIDGHEKEISYNDLIESNDCFILLMIEFLEFNYGIFSNAKRLLEILSRGSKKNSIVREIQYGKSKIVFTSKLKMRETSFLLPIACDTMVKLSFGEDRFLAHVSLQDIEIIQGYMCKYGVIKQDDGTESALNLMDLNRGIKDFIVLLCEFLEFNYGIFSQAQLMTAVIIGLAFEQAA